jgi:glycosyltransferase involved in cell wall biosynthesis
LPEIVIDGETGFLFAPRSIPAIVTVLRRVHLEQNRLPTMGEAGYHRLLKYFSKTRMIEATLNFYERLFSQSNS